MDDLYLTKACAEAMGYIPMQAPSGVLTVIDGSREFTYQPIHDDAQAMALVKRLGLWIQSDQDCWHVHAQDDTDIYHDSIDLNRAICECVAKLKSA